MIHAHAIALRTVALQKMNFVFSLLSVMVCIIFSTVDSALWLFSILVCMCSEHRTCYGLGCDFFKFYESTEPESET